MLHWEQDTISPTNIQIDLGLGRTFWNDKSIKSLGVGIPVDVTNKSYVLAIGVDFRL